MAEQLKPPSFQQLISWMMCEYKSTRSIFAIPGEKWHRYSRHSGLNIFNKKLEAPIGPAAGPHTQMAQNIISAYLTGSRFFELKTVQVLDELKIDKPCIDASDEGYNIEWSQELKLAQSYDEYLKAWILIHYLNSRFHFAESTDIIFNMSIGYDLKGIQSNQTDTFINGLVDASENELLNEYKEIIRNTEPGKQILTETIPGNISNSVTLSTMHGCPPEEIESIVKYLIEVKGLHTYVKLNPTLLGFDKVRAILDLGGYKYIRLDEASFDHDLKMKDAIPMLQRLKQHAKVHGKQFGIKLSNTLGVNNRMGILPGDQMYMSGRALYPLTTNLATALASEFNGDIPISFSGGASAYNTRELLAAGIFPVTYVTELLKPGGYLRLKQIAEITEEADFGKKIDPEGLNRLAKNALHDSYYHKDFRKVRTIKSDKQLPKFDCYTAPCTEACPAHQNVPEYISYISERRYADALAVIYSDNPLPGITGYICDHMCEFRCTRHDYDSAVKIRELKKLAAEKGFEEYVRKYSYPQITEGIKAAVIGAGPAGLTAAYYLAKAGFDVTVFEKEASAGGTVRHIIPGFRLPQEIINRDIEFIMKHGVKFNFNAGYEFSVQDLRTEGYKYIIAAIGAGLSNIPDITGSNKNRYEALEFLRAFKKGEIPSPGRNTAIVGGGNSAMDSARAALRCPGAENVYIVYRRTKDYMPADKEEFDAAISEGVIFCELLEPVDFSGNTLKCANMMLGEKDKGGRRKPLMVEGEFTYLNIDAVIFATGEKADSGLLSRSNTNAEDSVDPSSYLYIIGDALRGPSTVVKAVADGKSAADDIIKRENSSALREEIKSNADEMKIVKSKGIVQYEEEDLIKEAARCLQCNIICNKCVEVCPNRANIVVKSGPGFRDKYQVIHIDELCNECGNCETFCPYNGKPYKEKLSVSLSEICEGNIFQMPLNISQE